MKLAVILLTLCCLYVSHSQQQHLLQRRYPLRYFSNSYYDSPQLLSRNYLMRQAPVFVVRNNYVQPPAFYEHISMNDEVDGSDDYLPDDSSNWNEDIQGRAPALLGLNNKNSVANDKDGRFLFGNNNFLNFLRMSIATKTILTTVTSTITSATVKTCAGAAQFSATTACRRRRSVDDLADVAMVAPSQVEPMESSAAPPAAQIHKQRVLTGSVYSSAEIESSKQINNDDVNTNYNNLRLKRQLVLTASSTLTITSYSIVPSTITKRITLVPCDACVGCVPAGITIC